MGNHYTHYINSFKNSISIEEEKEINKITNKYTLQGITRIIGALAEHMLEKTNSDSCRGVLSFTRNLYEEVEPEVAFQAICKELEYKNYEPIKDKIDKFILLLGTIENPQQKLNELKRFRSLLQDIGYIF